MRGAAAQSWTVWIEVLLGLAVAVAVLGRGADGAAPSLVFLVGGAAAAYSAYVVYRAVVALTDDRLPTSADVEDRREALEYEKNLALAALKELDADAAMGKVDKRDLPTLKATAEARALALIKQIRDEDALWRRRAEQAVGIRPRERSAAPAPKRAPVPAAVAAGGAAAPPTAPELFDERPVEWEGTRCTGCGFENNPADARFCVQCGRPRGKA
jgi:hypothetical protein